MDECKPLALGALRGPGAKESKEAAVGAEENGAGQGQASGACSPHRALMAVTSLDAMPKFSPSQYLMEIR